MSFFHTTWKNDRSRHSEHHVDTEVEFCFRTANEDVIVGRNSISIERSKVSSSGVSGPSAHTKTTLQMTLTKVKFVRSPKTFSLQLISSDYGNCVYSSD